MTDCAVKIDGTMWRTHNVQAESRPPEGTERRVRPIDVIETSATLEARPIRSLHKEHIRAGIAEGVTQITQRPKPRPARPVAAVLRPDQKQRAARTILPAQHEVASQRTTTKIGIALRLCDLRELI